MNVHIRSIDVHFGPLDVNFRALEVTFHLRQGNVHIALYLGALQVPVWAMNIHIRDIDVHFGALDVNFRALEVSFHSGQRNVHITFYLGTLQIQVDFRFKSKSGIEILGALMCISGILNLGPFNFPSGPSILMSGVSTSNLGPFMSISGPLRSPSTLGRETSTSPFILGPLRLKSRSGIDILGALIFISGILNFEPFSFASGPSIFTSGTSMSTLGAETSMSALGRLTSTSGPSPLKPGMLNLGIFTLGIFRCQSGPWTSTSGASMSTLGPLRSTSGAFRQRNIHISFDLRTFQVQVKVRHGDLGGFDVHLGHLELGALEFRIRTFDIDIGNFNIHLGC
ncbi:hypothetical protein MC885_017780 [Smutsia gigantea]|nr:hypothetical protein MC885_017780 [Smutsia gigantea]